MRLHCVHGHGMLHWTLDTAAELDLDVPPPGLALFATPSTGAGGHSGSSAATEPCTGFITAPLGRFLIGSSVATEPCAGFITATLGRLLMLCITAPRELDAPPPGSMCSRPMTLGITAPLELDDDSAGVASTLGRFLLGMSLTLGLFLTCGVFLW